MNKIGIDFGTSFSTASWINPRTNQPEAITFHDTGMQKMPSVVYYGKEGIMVGLAAYNQLENSTGMDPEHRKQILQSMVLSIKRNMQKGKFFYLPNGEKKSHEDIIAAILKKIKEQSEITCFNGHPVEEATITHPVVFASWQKEMIKDAASKAGFKKIQLLEEPVAAALGYAATRSEPIRNVLVYDFGGGTFDVAFVECDEDGQFRVPIKPEGDAYCGGDDIDDIIYDHWEKISKEKFNRTIDINQNNRDIGFKSRCRKHKEQMSLFPRNQFSEVLPPPGFNRVEMEFKRKEYDSMVEPIIDRTINRTERLLKKVNEAGYTIDAAIMIGGSSRIPIVYEKLKSILPVDPEKVMQVDVAVALGAVIFNSNIKSVSDKYCMYCGGGENELKQSVSNKFCHFCGKKDWYC